MAKKKNVNEEPQEEQIEEAVLEEEILEETKAESDEDEEVVLKKKEYDEILQKSNENFEGWQRERAEFLNYKKRIEREQLSLKNFIIADIIKKYLAVMDDMELAFKNRPDFEACNGWVDGIGLIQQKLNQILESEGIEEIPAEGLEFDPNVHEAVTQIDSPDHESGMVIEVMRKGFKVGERVIRPALVIIAR